MRLKLTIAISPPGAEGGMTLKKDAFGLGRVALIAGSGRKVHAQIGLAWSLIQEKSNAKSHDLGGMRHLFNAAALAVGQSAQSEKSALGSNAQLPRQPARGFRSLYQEPGR